jgi:signal transduction histidine kinase/ActR/RegA family two-component response regulator
MRFWPRFTDWPLRAKMVALLAAASLVPLALAAYLDIRQTEALLLDGMRSLLEARGDELVRDLDTFHHGHLRSVERIALFPATTEFCAQPAGRRSGALPALQAILSTYPASDPNIHGAVVIDASGRVVASTEAKLVGLDVSFRAHVRAALQGRSVISDVLLSVQEVGETPSITYLAPVFGPDGKVACAAAIWLHAGALWQAVKASNALAGPNSYAVVYDSHGIRIAHTYDADIVFHPAGRLEPAEIEDQIAQRRFGSSTRALLEDVRAFPQHFERARAAVPDPGVFRGFAPVNQSWNYGVARRCKQVPWTVFYMVPELGIKTQIAQVTREKTLLALGIIAVASLLGLFFAAGILRPIRALRAATAALAGGDPTARVSDGRADELGQLGDSFNAMADRIGGQATALQRSRDELEQRVVERTAELTHTTEQLRTEVAERVQAEARLQAQLERLNLLDQITRAIGERQDMQSIYQVAIRSLEDRLPVDFSCVCRYDAVDATLTVTRVGVRSEALAMELAMGERASMPIDENGLARCVRGHLVYEPDIADSPFAFPQRLARGGLRSLVIAPLQSESRVFGMLVSARRQPNGFSSGECEFLRQLSAHVALAAQQSQLYSSLQQAYDDLRQTQQAVVQQERLRALGQMASGIAHDINNAISPIVLYTESLLEREPNLSTQAREYLQNIARAIDDVASTVSRMREFYRPGEPQLVLARLALNPLVQQVVDLTRARWSDLPQQRGIVIRADTDLGAGLPEIMGVASEIREALINLVFNAVDAMPEGGTLLLRTRASGTSDGAAHPDGPHVQVEVVDTGVGMDEDTQRRCLEPFFTTKGERGTGLGLATVYGAMQRQGADLTIDSVLGQGTTVRLSFAVAPADVAGPAVLAAAAAVPKRLRIMLVDDDPLLLHSLRDTLEADGHVVVTANGGQAGIDAVRATQASGVKFDVVITDLGMPYVDGRKVANAVKELAAAPPVILLTGWGQRLLDDGDVPPHVDAVLSKPPKLRDLREALARCCGLAPSAGRAADEGSLR